MPIELDPMDGKLHSHPDYFATKTTEEKTIYVNADSGSDTTGDGSSSAPYKTIEKAFSMVPAVIDHSITIYLQAASSVYDKAYLKNKVFSNPNATFTIRGEMTVVDSGTVSSASGSVADPVYGASVSVSSITDSTKSWTTNAHKYKLLRVYKAGQQDQYRIITYNSANTLYVSYQFSPTPDNTWSYQILNWASVVGGMDIRNFFGPVYIYFIHSLTSSPYPLQINNVPYARFEGCRFSKNTISASHAIRMVDAYMIGYATLVDSYDNTNYDGLVYDYGRFCRADIYGTIFKGFRYGVWFPTTNGVIRLLAGTRIVEEGSGVSIGGALLDGPSLLIFYSYLGKVVIDNGATGISGNNGARIAEVSPGSIYFGSGVTTQYNITDAVGNFSAALSDGPGVDINGKMIRIRTSKTPASGSAFGNIGEICWDSDYLYVCVGTNTWKRVALSTF